MNQRLFEIVYLLAQKGNTNAGELAERFGVSRRTIYRDIDALSLAGIPLYTQKGKGGGIYILPDFVLDKSLLSKDEQSQLVSHFESLASIGTPDTEGLLTKLSAMFGQGASWLEVDFTPWGSGEETSRIFRLIRDSILRHQIVQFIYTSSKGQQVERIVEPLRIVFKGQGWYLYAYCRLREDYRYFKFTRISNLHLVDDYFSREMPTISKELPAETVELFDILIRFKPCAAYRVYDEFKKDQVSIENNGYLNVHCQFPDSEWVLGYLLSFGPDAQIIEPSFLRTKFKDFLKKMMDEYI